MPLKTSLFRLCPWLNSSDTNESDNDSKPQLLRMRPRQRARLSLPPRWKLTILSRTRRESYGGRLEEDLDTFALRFVCILYAFLKRKNNRITVALFHVRVVDLQRLFFVALLLDFQPVSFKWSRRNQ